MHARAAWPVPEQRGIGAATPSRAMLPNVPAMFEAHFGVPMTGAVLNTLNTRLDAEAIAFMLQHGEAKVLLTDREFLRGDRQGTCDARRQAAVRDRSRG
jgi:acyl-CoA synthetase (AMP-forming)/AMP-acid ligase II